MSTFYLPTFKNELSRLKIFLVFVFITITSASFAQSIFENAITGTDPSNNNPYSTGQTIVNGISSTGIGYGTGLNNSNASDRYNTNGFSTNGTLNAANNDFISWTITPSNCFEVDLTSLVIAYQRSGQGPQNLALRSSVDGFSTNIWSVTGITAPEQTSTISLSAVFYQNLTTAITFRLYGWNAGNTNGTFSLNSFTFNGAVNSTNTAVAGAITGINSVCSGSNTTLTVAGYTGNIQWQTSTDNITFTNITGATTETYSTPNINATTYYRAGSTAGTCPTLYSSSYAVNITLPNMTAVGGSACGSSTVDLAVNQVCQPAGATTNWYASSTGGTSLATGDTYTTPILNSTTTYYASNNYSAGAALSTGNRSTTNQRGLRFNALASFVLNSVQINTNNAGSITLELRDNLNQPVAGIAAVVYTATAGTNTVPLGWTIPAGTGYRIIKTAGTPQLSRTDPFTFPIGTAGVLSITSSEDNGAIENTRYFYFYNWDVSTIRIPVVATINTIQSDVTTSACGTYTWAANGVTYSTSGVYYYVGPCNTATLNLTINPATGTTTTASACGSYTWSVNGQTYTSSGTYTHAVGCHTYTLALTITPNTSSTTTASACDTYTWSVDGQTYTSSGTYTSVSGCLTQILELTITPSSTNSSTVSSCGAYTWPINGQTYNSSGTYSFLNGCQTEILNLTVNTIGLIAINGSNCGTGAVGIGVNDFCPITGSTINWYAATSGGTSLGTGTSYTTPSISNTTNYYASSNFTAGATLSTANRSATLQRGLLFNTFIPILLNSVQINTNGAGSITLELRDNLNQPVAGAAAVVYTATAGTNTVPLGWTIPAGTGYRIIKTAGTIQFSRTDPFTFPIGVNGVLSITSSVDAGAVDNTRYFYFYNWNVSTVRIPVVATIITPTTPTFTQVSSICSGATLNALPTTSNNGITGTWSPELNNTSTTTYTFTPTAGQCASTATMTITVNPNTNNTTTASACDSYTWSENGQTYTTSGTYTSVTGCHTETLVLTITAGSTTTTYETACGTYTWSVNGQQYSSSGTYTVVNGCATDILELTIITGITNTTVANACDAYVWDADGQQYTESGTYTFVSGCTTEILELTITPSSSNYTVASACDAYTWAVNGQQYTTSGTYLFEVGCLTEVLELTITPSTNTSTTVSACDSYTWSVNGTTYTTSGTYTSVTGCHTETLVLTITPSTNNTTTASACDTYTWSVNGTTYTTSGTYTSVTGCHTETLVLTITPSTNNTTIASACDTYTWSVNGTIYTTSGTYTSVTGCHTETLVLTITPSTNNTTTASACDSYTWSVNGTTYTTSGTYTSVTGCHTETLVLTITPSTNNTTTASACDSYTWSVNGTTYTTSGTYTSVTGCHTETLVLTITPSTNNTTTASACDSYTWSVNGTSYTTGGTYTSVTGCHTETLVLTITPSTNNTTTASACDTYTWSVNGTIYTTSGTYTSVTGCHTETLVLTITPSTNNTTTASACDSYTWSVNGTSYTTSGTYTSVTGCHTETLVLTITPSTNNTTTASSCDSYTWSVNGTTYTTSGTYTSVTGCHTETLVLTVNTSSVYYADADGDGFGSTVTANFCTMPSTGFAISNTDCNDAVATTYPGAVELCNSVDDNCSGFIDEGCPSTIAGEEPFNSVSAPSSMYSYCSSFYGTLEGAFPSTLAQSTCVTGEDRWYNFTALTTGVTIFIGSNANDIVIELQDGNGNVIEVENTVIGVGTEVLTKTGLTVGANYRVGVRNYNSGAQAGGQFSGCIRHLRAGGADSGTSATWPSTLSTCSLFKAAYCGGTGVQYRYTWTGLTGTAAGQVFTKTQTSDYLNVTAVTPSLHAGCMYNVLVTAIYSIPNGAGINEVVEMPAIAPTTITISPAASVALRSTDQIANGPRYRGSIVASLPWVCGVTNWRWRFTEVNPLTMQTVGLPIEQNRGAASNYINLNSVTALQNGKTYAVQTAPVFSYTGNNYQWGPVSYMAIIGNAGLIIDASEDATASQDVTQDRQVEGPSEGLSENLEISVYPNPTHGNALSVSLSGIDSDNVQVKVYDALGRKIESKRFVVEGTLQTTLNFTSELSNGLYILEVNTEDVTRSVRFMVEQ